MKVKPCNCGQSNLKISMEHQEGDTDWMAIIGCRRYACEEPEVTMFGETAMKACSNAIKQWNSNHA